MCPLCLITRLRTMGTMGRRLLTIVRDASRNYSNTGNLQENTAMGARWNRKVKMGYLTGMRKDHVPTLLEVCSSTASDEQSVPSESHALVPQYQGYTPISVSWCFSHYQTLVIRNKKKIKKISWTHFLLKSILSNYFSNNFSPFTMY